MQNNITNHFKKTGPFGPRSRIKKKRDFDRLFAARQSIANKHLVMYYLPNHGDQSRLGLVIGKRYGNAVKRNQFKRWLREVFRQERTYFRSHLDVLILPKAGTHLNSFHYPILAEDLCWQKFFALKLFNFS